MSETSLADLYVSVLEGMGLMAKPDGDGDVLFKYPDLGTMFFSVDASDPEYLMLVFPNFADESALKISQTQLLFAINAVNSKSKAVKLWARPDQENKVMNVSATVEAFIAPPDTLPDSKLLGAVIKRNISALRAAVMALIKESRELSDQSI